MYSDGFGAYFKPDKDPSLDAERKALIEKIRGIDLGALDKSTLEDALIVLENRYYEVIEWKGGRDDVP